jgi:hypothetical protein
MAAVGMLAMHRVAERILVVVGRPKAPQAIVGILQPVVVEGNQAAVVTVVVVAAEGSLAVAAGHRATTAQPVAGPVLAVVVQPAMLEPPQAALASRHSPFSSPPLQFPYK